MKSAFRTAATVLAALLLLVLLIAGFQQREGLEYVNEPLRGHLDITPSDFKKEGLTHIRGWAHIPPAFDPFNWL